MHFEKKLILYFTALLVIGLALSFIMTEHILPVSSVNAYTEPIIKTEEIDVEVLSVNQKQWSDYTYHNVAEVTVYSKEHDISNTIIDHARGFDMPKHWDAKKGDIVRVKITYWVQAETNTILRKEIRSFV